MIVTWSTRVVRRSMSKTQLAFSNKSIFCPFASTMTRSIETSTLEMSECLWPSRNHRLSFWTLALSLSLISDLFCAYSRRRKLSILLEESSKLLTRFLFLDFATYFPQLPINLGFSEGYSSDLCPRFNNNLKPSLLIAFVFRYLTKVWADGNNKWQ
jgi:hypothetical protein